MPIRNIKVALPACVTPEVKDLIVFRAADQNRVFLGLRIENVFKILFMEVKHGEIYDH
jgi:hypothetical protein